MKHRFISVYFRAMQNCWKRPNLWPDVARPWSDSYREYPAIVWTKGICAVRLLFRRTKYKLLQFRNAKKFMKKYPMLKFKYYFWPLQINFCDKFSSSLSLTWQNFELILTKEYCLSENIDNYHTYSEFMFNYFLSDSVKICLIISTMFPWQQSSLISYQVSQWLRQMTDL